MEDEGAIPCVIYGAKSTEDRRGSIPEQLEECRAAIDADPRRRLVAEYTDEAVSAYRNDRGAGLRDASQHAEDLAVDHGIAEIWAQHSDRLARGDGRQARHTVEIALWALKHDVRVRTLQDPDTFRDLLYAVVTGQRNNEDSKRKGSASKAGRKRAAIRGEFIGHLPDGYQLIIELDRRGELLKRMELDPVRRPLIELIFRLALRGRTTGQIAKTIHNAGWLTKPVKKGYQARPFDTGRVYELLKNARYAALGSWEGEIVARGHWPAYISERQHEAIQKRLAAPRPANGRRRLETYLLTRLAFCGECGNPFHTRTGRRHRDGTFARHYVCSSHSKHRGRAQCKVPPFDAHTAEVMVVASIGSLLVGDPVPGDISPVEAPPGPSGTIAEHELIRRAVIAGSGEDIDVAIEQLFSQMHPHAALIRGTAISQRQARELKAAEPLRAWIDREAQGRTEATREEAPALNLLLRGWFSAITIKVDPVTITVTAARRHARENTAPIAVEIDRAAWARFAPPERARKACTTVWSQAEIIGALQAWADTHGRSPASTDWGRSGVTHPEAKTVRNHFASWNEALRRASLEPHPSPPPRYAWDQLDMIKAFQAWTRERGRPPASMEWAKAEPEHPCSQTVRTHFGTWPRALSAAGLTAQPKLPSRIQPWTNHDVTQALRRWAVAHQRSPFGTDWLRAASDHPCTGTVRKQFGSWSNALAAAGLAPPDGHSGA